MLIFLLIHILIAVRLSDNGYLLFHYSDTVIIAPVFVTSTGWRPDSSDTW